MKPTTTKFMILCLMAIMILAACGTDEGTQPTAETESSGQIETGPTATVISEEPLPAPPTTTPVPTAEIPATNTPPPVTPTATVPPAEHENVDQAPYAESECSDKYPCNDDAAGWEARLRVAPGFNGRYFARIDDLPTSLTIGPDGLLYVAGRSGTIYQIDENGEATPFIDGFTVPTGIAFQPGTERLFVSNRVNDRNVDGEGQVSVVEEGQISTLIANLPCCYIGMHGPNGIAFGPDGYGYVGVGGRADHGERLVEPDVGSQDDLSPVEASILRFDPDEGSVEIYARGFRNPYDIAWASTGTLYATDNGRDPDPETGESPPDEVHMVAPGGEHGYPYYECSVCFGIPEGIDIIPAILELVPHAAVTGIEAFRAEAMPEYYDDLFIVLWSAFEGAQKVIRYSPDTDEASDFATGFAQPIDVTIREDGRLYVADYATGIIFEISPEPQVE